MPASTEKLSNRLQQVLSRLNSWVEGREGNESAIEELVRTRACLELCIFHDDVHAILNETSTIQEQASVYD